MALAQQKVTVELSQRDRDLLERIARALEATRVELSPTPRYAPNESRWVPVPYITN